MKLLLKQLLKLLNYSVNLLQASSANLYIIKLKGSLADRGYIHIIHIIDKDEDFHIKYLTLLPIQKTKCCNLSIFFIAKESLSDSVSAEKA